MAAVQRKKIGEKGQVLELAWKVLSGSSAISSGGVRVTQGIYAKTEDGKTDVFCKRGVLVPKTFDYERLSEVFRSFGAELSDSICEDSVVGFCGMAPTRTARADDTIFFLLAHPHDKFVVVAIITVDDNYRRIVDLKSDAESLANAVKWVKEESEKRPNGPPKKRGKYNKNKQELPPLFFPPTDLSDYAEFALPVTNPGGIVRPRQQEARHEVETKEEGETQEQPEKRTELNQVQHYGTVAPVDIGGMEENRTFFPASTQRTYEDSSILEVSDNEAFPCSPLNSTPSQQSSDPLLSCLSQDTAPSQENNMSLFHLSETDYQGVAPDSAFNDWDRRF